MTSDLGRWEKILAELERRRAFAQSMGGAERVERHRNAGKLDARQRAEALFDDGTFVELRGASGMKCYPHRVMIARFEGGRNIYRDAAEARAVGVTREQIDEHCWRTVQGDCCTDDGAMPTEWRPAT